MTSLAALKTCRTLQCVRSQSPQAQRLRLQSHIPARSVRSIPMERRLWGRGCWRGRGVSRFGVAFNEPSGPCLTRSGGTNEELRGGDRTCDGGGRAAFLRGGDARHVPD
jgi:hypothetical protein